MKLQLFRAGDSFGDASDDLFDLVPSKILGIGKNYRDHAKEMGGEPPDEPLMFLKPRSAMLPSGGQILRPSGYERVDHEAELGVIIGTRASAVSEATALDYVLGYTCVNDVSVRDLQRKDGQWTRAKGFDTFCPIGPHIVTGLDPTDLAIEARVNGEVRQRARTSDMIFSVAQLIAFASNVMTLEPGDVIATGTPSGVANLSPGDRVEVEIEGIGILVNDVVERANR